MDIKLITYDHGSRNNNKISLTFDDGPNPFWTLKVLDTLDKFNIKANFFILGKWAERYPNIIKETFARGHLIGNHTYSHPKEGCGDFEKAEEIIFNVLGEHTKFIRPPYNNIDLCNCYNPAINGKVKIINNEVVPQDWQKKFDEIITSIEKKTQNGSIILLHDGSHQEQELENRPSEMFKALPDILKKLKTKFDIVRLDELNFDI